MNKKLVPVLALGLGLLLASGCARGTDTVAQAAPALVQNTMIDEFGTVDIPVPQDAYNLLSGRYDLARDRDGMRPFAFDVNNLYECWPSAGLSQAEILIEYEAATGIPRFMALYADIRDLARVGSIRSLRMTGMIPIYQMDPIVVCMGMFVEVDDFLYSNGFRILDGVANPSANFIYTDDERRESYSIEHCRYTSGSLIYHQLQDISFVKPIHAGAPLAPMFDFRPEDSPAVPGGGAADAVEALFSDYAGALRYVYDPAAARYLRFQYGEPQIDANNGEQLGFDNVLLLFCAQEYPDEYFGYIPETDFAAGGEGVWLSRGGYQRFSWRKADAAAPFEFTTATGAPLRLNAGTTCLTLIDDDNSDTLVLS